MRTVVYGRFDGGAIQEEFSDKANGRELMNNQRQALKTNLKNLMITHSAGRILEVMQRACSDAAGELAGSCDGVSRASAFETLQEALKEVQQGAAIGAY